jgi:hypothetical protein
VRSLQTFDESEAYCNSLNALNAMLVTITDRFEQYWLNQFQISSDIKWIGLADRNSSGIYAWLNKEPISFVNWDRFRPGIIFYTERNKKLSLF